MKSERWGRLSESVLNIWPTLISQIGQGMKAIKAFFRHEVVESDVLSGLNVDLDHLYDDPSVATQIQNRYLENLKRQDMLRPKYKQYINNLAVLQRIELLPAQIKKEVEKLCQIYSETLVKKGEYRQQIQGKQGTQTEYLERYEDNMVSILKMMEEHEANQSLVKQDLAYLESEKAELVYQERRLKKAYSFVRGAFVFVALGTALAAFVLSILLFVYHQKVLVGAMIAMVAIIVATVWIYVFRRYVHAELKKNQKLQKRAIELANKTKIKFVNNQKVIDYQRQKYKVDSSEMLRFRWENYKSRQLVEKQYKNISNSIAAMMGDIESILKKQGIEDVNLILDYLDYFTSSKGRQLLMAKLNQGKEAIKQEMDLLEKENNVINIILTNYKGSMSTRKG